MYDAQTFFAFLAASLVIIIAPGPAQALVLTRSLGRGPMAGVLTALGLNAGTLFHTVAAGLGVSAILAASSFAFSVVKFAGAMYLIYLGVRGLFTSGRSSSGETTDRANPAGTFVKSVVTGVLNPKVALFFLAFLPQFVDPARGAAFPQYLVLGLVIAGLDVVYESALAFLAGGIGSRFLNSTRLTTWRERVSGFALVALGVRLALVRRA